MVKKETITRKVNLIDDYFNRIQEGRWTGLKIQYITDQIVWLWKYRHITEEEMVRLTDRAIYIMDRYRPE